MVGGWVCAPLFLQRVLMCAEVCVCVCLLPKRLMSLSSRAEELLRFPRLTKKITGALLRRSTLPAACGDLVGPCRASLAPSLSAPLLSFYASCFLNFSSALWPSLKSLRKKKKTNLTASFCSTLHLFRRCFQNQTTCC